MNRDFIAKYWYAYVYDPVIRICTGTKRWELTTNNGGSFIIWELWHKHIPSREQVYGWLREAGLIIEKSFKNYTDEPIPEPLDESMFRATIWARKD